MLLDLDHITLIPRVVSTIKSRGECNTSSKLGSLKLKLPFIASPMVDVCDGNIARLSREAGGLGIIHRFCEIKQQVKWFRQAHQVGITQCSGGAAIGINGDYRDRFWQLSESGCNLFCLDIANGGNTIVESIINELLGLNPSAEFIVGNVASAECFSYLDRLPGVVGVRCGIAGGSACTTKNATGIYHPMASLLEECREIREKAAIIADGGINTIDKICKAIAIGADCVMLGRMVAATHESPAVLEDHRVNLISQPHKVYRGSASYEIQELYRSNPKYIEGTIRYIPLGQVVPFTELINSIRDGLQSSMSYVNAHNLTEYRHNIRIGRIV